MEPSKPVAKNALRARIKELIDQPPEDPSAREALLEQLLHEITAQEALYRRELEDLRAAEQHLAATAAVLQEENQRLRDRLAGKREAEESVSQQAEAFRGLAENSPDAIVRLDRQMRHLYANPAALRISGMTPAGLLGHSIEEIDIYAPLLPYFGIVRQVFETGEEIRAEIPYDTHRNRYWFDVRVAPELGPSAGPGTPRVETVLVIAREITLRKRLEAAMRRAEERFRVATDRTGMAVFEQDSHLRYTWFHTPHAQPPPAAVIGQRDEDLFPPNEAARLNSLKRRVLESGQGLREEIELTMAGQKRIFDMLIEPLFDEEDAHPPRNEVALSDAGIPHSAETPPSTSQLHENGKPTATASPENLGLPPGAVILSENGVVEEGSNTESQPLEAGPAVEEDRKAAGSAAGSAEDSDAAPPPRRVIGLLGSMVDVTSRRLAERETAFRAHLLDNVHDAIVATDERLLITGWNRSAEALYGWKAGEVMGRPVYEVIPSEFTELEYTEAGRVLHAGKMFSAVMIQRTRTGQRLWVDCQGIALRDESGRLTGYISANRDVTARRELEMENRRQRDLLENIFQSDPSGLALACGPDLLVEMANDAFRAITPHPELDPKGRPLAEIWPPAEGYNMMSMLNPVIADNGSLTLEKVEQVHPDGQRRSFTLHARPMPWHTQPAVMLVAWETTQTERAREEADRRAAEAEEARRTFEAMMEYIPEAIIIATAPDLLITYTSKYAAGLVGRDRAGLENTTVSQQSAIWNMHRPDGVTPLKHDDLPLTRAALEGEVIQDEEVVLVQGQRKISLMCSAGPIRDASGRVLGSIMVARDHTERRRTESHQRFLSELGKTLVALTQPADILQGVANRLGSHLGADRCFITEASTLSGPHIVSSDYHPGRPSLSGASANIGMELPVMNSLRAGKIVVIGDAANDPRISAVYELIEEPLRMSSLVLAPWLNRERRWTGTLVVASEALRQWRLDEVELIGSVADMTWLALENARLFQDLLDFRQRFEVALRSAPITVYTQDRNRRYTWVFSTRPDLNAEQMLGKRDEDLPTTEQAPELVEMKQTVIKTGVGMRKEIRLRQPDGSPTIFDVTIEPLHGRQGEVTGLTVAAMEVTDLRRMEAEAMQNTAQIEVQRRLIQEREVERTRIARELHDGPLQELIATSYTLVEAMEINEKTERLAKMRAIQLTLQRQVQELRRFCYELRPPALGPFGLEKTIHSHAEGFRQRYPRLNLHLQLQRDGLLLSEEVRLVLFRVYQELLTNVVRHASAQNAWVRFQLLDDEAVLEVEDDGKGFTTPEEWVQMAREGHLGLVGVKERVEVFNGRVNVISQPGKGTRIKVVVKTDNP